MGSRCGRVPPAPQSQERYAEERRNQQQRGSARDACSAVRRGVVLTLAVGLGGADDQVADVAGSCRCPGRCGVCGRGGVVQGKGLAGLRPPGIGHPRSPHEGQHRGGQGKKHAQRQRGAAGPARGEGVAVRSAGTGARRAVEAVMNGSLKARVLVAVGVRWSAGPRRESAGAARRLPLCRCGRLPRDPGLVRCSARRWRGRRPV